MRDEKCRAALNQFAERIEQFGFGARVEGARRFIQNQQLRRAQKRSGERDFLPLTDGQFFSAIEIAA